MRIRHVPAAPAWALAIVVAASGCQTDGSPFPVIVGASSAQSDIRPCSDYASYTSYTGRPYSVLVPETGRTTTRHEGIDFCTDPGADVLAPATGKVIDIVRENAHRGGHVTIETRIEYRHNDSWVQLYLEMVHITPRSTLRVGDEVKAGDVIGVVEPPGKLAIGPRSHVHLSAGPSIYTTVNHTDPNRFWQKGPGVVTCFNPSAPPSNSRMVAPVRC